MAFKGGAGMGELRGEINVTPMIDVLLVLLIIFMVIVPAIPNGLVATLPQRTNAPHLEPENPIVVQIMNARNGELSYKINQEEVNIADLGSRLSTIFAERAERVMFVKADATLDFLAIARVMDIGKAAGVDHIGLLTAKDGL
jgi:biopolymer transport protein ExbD